MIWFLRKTINIFVRIHDHYYGIKSNRSTLCINYEFEYVHPSNNFLLNKSKFNMKYIHPANFLFNQSKSDIELVHPDNFLLNQSKFNVEYAHSANFLLNRSN